MRPFQETLQIARGKIHHCETEKEGVTKTPRKWELSHPEKSDQQILYQRALRYFQYA